MYNCIKAISSAVTMSNLWLYYQVIKVFNKVWLLEVYSTQEKLPIYTVSDNALSGTV